MVSTVPTTARRTRGAHQWLSLLVGLAFLVVGLWGFALTGIDDLREVRSLSDILALTGHETELLWFGINPLHNLVHVVVGLLGILLGAGRRSARLFGLILLLGYGAAVLYGLLALDGRVPDYLNVNAADNWLHLGGALAGLVILLWPVRRGPVATPAGEPWY